MVAGGKVLDVQPNLFHGGCPGKEVLNVQTTHAVGVMPHLKLRVLGGTGVLKKDIDLKRGVSVKYNLGQLSQGINPMRDDPNALPALL